MQWNIHTSIHTSCSASCMSLEGANFSAYEAVKLLEQVKYTKVY